MWLKTLFLCNRTFLKLSFMSLTEEILSQLPGDILGGLRRADTILTSLRDNNSPIPNVVKEIPKI